MKIVDVCEFYSPTGGGVRRYINQKLALAGKFGARAAVGLGGVLTLAAAVRFAWSLRRQPIA